MMSNKREYQENDLKKITAEFSAGTKALLYQAVTGSGKSVVASNFIEGKVSTENAEILVLAHRRKLVDQLEAHMQKKGLDVGKMIGSVEKGLTENVLVASVHTATREKRLATILKTKKIKYIVVDEAHRIMSASYRNILDEVMKQNPEAQLLGITATPHRRDRKDLREVFTKMICSLDMAELIKLGYIADVVTFCTPTVDLDSVERNSNDYKITALSTYMKNPSRINFCVDTYLEKGENKQVLIFCVDKSHAKAMQEAFTKKGIAELAYIDADTSDAERDAIFAQFENKEIQGIISIETLIEGVDLQGVECILNARPTKSLTIFMQMGGRGTRPKPNGEALLFLDCAGSSKEFGVLKSPKSWSLNPAHDPCSEQKEMKVVGKKKNGSYTLDLDEEEGMEIEELTAEEYVSRLVSDLDSAEAYNKDLEIKIKNAKIELANGILKVCGLNKRYEVTEEELNSQGFGIKKIGAGGWNDTVMTLSFSGDFVKVAPRGDGNVDRTSNATDLKIAITILEETLHMNKYFINDSNRKDFLAEWAIIEAMGRTRVNVQQLREKKKELDEQQKEEKIDAFIQEKGGVIEFDRHFKLDDIFPHVGWDYRRERMVKMVVIKKSLKTKNSIELIDKNGRIEYKSESVKKTKIIEIIEQYSSFNN